ncbi:MAG: GGDEF domain-containing protein [Candidatus Omnitrophica bacterium]|nr:GGDEF domain-containing protein [Candidatus Omnitrophota bacterium]
MSETDFLTGCFSKEVISPMLDKIKAECKIYKVPFSVLVIDLDHFKAYNDKYGHIDGDEALKYFASTLRLSLREEETTIFRFGGDEFVIVFSGKNSKEARLTTISLMKNLKRRPFLSGGRIFKLRFSAGIASYPSDGNEVETILQKADKAMYFSKTHGRGKVTLHSHILRVKIKSVLFVLIGALLIVGVLSYLKNSSYRDQIMEWLKRETGKASTVLTSVSIKTNDKAPDTVYLKSGRVLKGVIVRDNEDGIELNLSLQTGAGSVMIRRSDIERISPRQKHE